MSQTEISFFRRCSVCRTELHQLADDYVAEQFGPDAGPYLECMNGHQFRVNITLEQVFNK